MRLSEAIRLGATMCPQAFGRLFKDDGTCALGAAYDAIGRRPEMVVGDVPIFQVRELPEEWHSILKMLSGLHCPVCGSMAGTTLPVITHLNDAHQWTRERIADFVELHEIESLPENPNSETLELWQERSALCAEVFQK